MAIVRARSPPGDNLSVVDRVLSSMAEIKQQPASLQVAFGTTGGFVTGYFLGKTSKMAALFIGSSIVLFQIAECQGYVKLRKQRLKADLDAARDQLGALIGEGLEMVGGSGDLVLQRKASRNVRDRCLFAKKIKFPLELSKLVVENARLIGGFIGGILIGFGLS